MWSIQRMPSSSITDVGEKFPKQDGTDWTAEELQKLPKGTILSAFIKGDQTFYAPFDQRTKTATWDNEVHQINEAGDISESTVNPLGAARVPTVGTHQVPGMNPGEKITLSSSSTPVTPKSATRLTPADTSQFMVTPNPKGLVEPGNLPIWTRLTVQNADGSHSSEYST